MALYYKNKKAVLVLVMSCAISTLSNSAEKDKGRALDLGERAAQIRDQSQSNSVGSDLPGGANVGLPAAALLAAGAERAGAVVAAGATATKAAVMAAAPYVGGAAAVGAVGYGGYKIYRHYNPTPEQQAQDADYKMKAAESRKKASLFEEEEQFSRCRMSYKKCLSINSFARRNSFGIPLPCQQSALDLAVQGGEGEVDKITKSFLIFAPAPREKDPQ